MVAKMILLGILTVTSYRPVPGQTRPECRDRFHCATSIGDGLTRYGAAVSQDLIRSGAIHYGDVLYVEGFGYRVVNDVMNERHKRRIDLLVFTRDEEKIVGERKLRIYKVDSDFVMLPNGGFNCEN